MTNTLRVHLRRIIDDSYDIIFGKNFSQAAKDILHLEFGSHYFVITDTNVKELYAQDFVQTIKKHGAHCELLVVNAGEKSKNRRTKEQLENKLLSLKAGRDPVIIALGGGMVGDLAGFVAATLHRGVPFIQIPTTLLSQVDSSIGGKVAVDHLLGKNLLGAFYQPKRVYIDVSTLKSLSDREFSNGMAEVIKYACILDASLFSYLENNYPLIMKRSPLALNRIIKRCCELKRNIVEKDEKETGLRRILNFGHTIGHAIEHLSHYRLPHGRAIAIGIVAEARMAASLGMLSHKEVHRIQNLLQACELPIAIPASISMKQLFQATMHDKKVRKGIVQYTLLERIGKGRTGIGISLTKADRLLTL